MMQVIYFPTFLLLEVSTDAAHGRTVVYDCQ